MDDTPTIDAPKEKEKKAAPSFVLNGDKLEEWIANGPAPPPVAQCQVQKGAGRQDLRRVAAR
jgi:hypothetical protein